MNVNRKAIAKAELICYHKEKPKERLLMIHNFTTRERKLTYDGNVIFGMEYVPEKQCEKTNAVIMSHGYNSSYADMNDIAEKLAAEGIYVYCYDFCGGSTRSLSSGKTTDMDINTEIRDLSAVIADIEKRTDIDRIYLYGESQGGFVSALTAAENSERISGLILVYPAFCIPDDWLGRDESTLSAPFDFMGMTISKKFYDGVPRYDVFEKMRSFKKHTVIFHGDCDNVVRLSYAQRLYGVLPDAELTVINGEGHGFSGAVRSNIANKICGFVKEQKCDRP